MATKPKLWTMPTPEGYANRAGAGVRSAYDASVGAANRNMTRMGINPNSGRFAGTRARLARDEAADVAGARQQGYAQGQQANAQYGLQRDAAVRQWAQLALQQRQANFGNRMAKKQFRLNEETHGLNMERGKFDLDQARTMADRRDTSWTWAQEDRKDDKAWQKTTRGWQKQDRVWDEKTRTWKEQDRDTRLKRDETLWDRGTTQWNQGQEDRTRRNRILDKQEQWGDEDREWNVGVRKENRTWNARTRQWETEDRTRKNRILDKQEQRSDDAYAIGDMSEAERIQTYIDTELYVPEETSKAVKDAYERLQKEHPEWSETRLMREAARNTYLDMERGKTVDLSGYEKWKAEQMAPRGKSPLRRGDMVKGETGYWTSKAKQMGLDEGSMYDEEGKLTKLGNDFLDTLNAMAKRAPEGMTEQELILPAAQQVGLKPKQWVDAEAEVRELAADDDNFKKGRTTRTIDAQYNRISGLPLVEQYRIAEEMEREADKNKDEVRKQAAIDLHNKVFDAESSQLYGEAGRNWAKMSPEDQSAVVDRLVRRAFVPDPELRPYFEPSKGQQGLTPEGKADLIRKLLGGEGTVEEALQALNAKFEAAKPKPRKEPPLPRSTVQGGGWDEMYY